MDCPYGQRGKTTPCDFSSYKIKDVQDKIENMKWYLGGIQKGQGATSAEDLYTKERGTTPAGSTGSALSTTAHI